MSAANADGKVYYTFTNSILRADLGAILHCVEREVDLGHRPFLLYRAIQMPCTVHVGDCGVQSTGLCLDVESVGSDRVPRCRDRGQEIKYSKVGGKVKWREGSFFTARLIACVDRYRDVVDCVDNRVVVALAGGELVQLRASRGE